MPVYCEMHKTLFQQILDAKHLQQNNTDLRHFVEFN